MESSQAKARMAASFNMGEGDDQAPEFLEVWNSPEIVEARRDLARRNGLRKWFAAALSKES